MYNNPQVVFCSLAYNAEYRVYSRTELLNSYNKYASDYKLIIATDDPSYYHDDVIKNGNIIPIKIDLPPSKCPKKAKWFPYNAKVFSVEYALTRFSPECIIFLDADNTFNRRENFEDFLILEEGLSVVLGKETAISDIRNGTIREKAEFLFRDGEILYQFKEAGLIFRIKSQDKMQHVVNEWKNIFHTSHEYGICQAAECIDIALACQRANFPIINIRENWEIYKLVGSGLFSTYSPAYDEYHVCVM